MLKLIWNDIKLYKTGLLFILFYALIFLVGFNRANAFSMSIGMFAVYMFTIGILNIEERDGIDLLHRYLPVTIKEIVGAKYTECIIISMAYAVVAFISQAAISLFTAGRVDAGEILPSILLTVSASLVFCSVTIPLIYKFGLVKSRIIGVIIFAFIIAALTAAGSIGMFYRGPFDFGALYILSLIPAAAAMALSYSLSLRIYRKKG